VDSLMAKDKKEMVLLSICIPTYNRSGYLKKTLESIVRQKEFYGTQNVEVVISDNDSTDDTKAIAGEFIKKFGTKIKYFYNQVNIGDANFEKVLSLGKGQFLKLNNDTLEHLPYSLEKMLAFIKINIQNKPILFFSNSVKNNNIVNCLDLNSFIKEVSFLNTWIGAFGIWKDAFDSIKNFSRYKELCLVQTDVLCRLISLGSKVVVYNKKLAINNLVPKKGGYDFAKVFGHNYLFILKEFIKSNYMSKKVYNREKKLLLTRHINCYFFDHEKKYDFFSKTRYLKWLFPDYKNEFYFYLGYIKNYGKMLGLTLKGNLAQLCHKPVVNGLKVYRIFNIPIFCKKVKNYKWRVNNTDNFTEPVNNFDYNKVIVGAYTYGDLCVLTDGSVLEKLYIGKFCSIAANVKFILSSGHPYEGFSAYPFKVKIFGKIKEAVSKGDIIINDDVLIGLGAIILSGVTIGQGAIVVAGAVVIKDVEPYSIVAGNPARFIKYRFSEDIRKKLLNFDFKNLSKEIIF
jgi:acetyltransferase-like isoleucine patch superfamily enzyme